MAYTKYSLTPANNNATPPDGAPEGMLPSAVNDTMRDMMAQIRDCGDGIRDGTYTMTAPKITGGTITGAAFTGNTFTSPVISGGSINNTPIGGTTANSGAFTTLSASGVATISAGTVSAPALTTTGDTNTGIFFPAADTIAFTEGGVESMRIDSNGFVGVGTTSPEYSGSAGFVTVTTQGSSASYFVARGSGTTVKTIYGSGTANGNLGTTTNHPLVFNTNNTERMRIDSSGNVVIANSSARVRLDVRSDAVIAAPTPLANAVASGVFAIGDTVGSVFGLQLNGSSYDTYIQARNMGASSTAYNLLLQPLGGNVGIGTSTITSGAGWTPTLVLSATSAALVVKGINSQENSFGTSNGLYIDCLGNSTGTNNNIIFRNTSANSNFNAVERMRITSGGVLELAQGQIKFPSTQSASSDANTLDDYEEGTFTPSVVGQTTAGTFTYSTREGKYTKIGNVVNVQIAIYVSATSVAASGVIYITGLPFTISNANNTFTSFNVGWLGNVTFSGFVTAYGDANTSTFLLRETVSGAYGGIIGGAQLGGAFYIFVSGNYMAST